MIGISSSHAKLGLQMKQKLNFSRITATVVQCCRITRRNCWHWDKRPVESLWSSDVIQSPTELNKSLDGIQTPTISVRFGTEKTPEEVSRVQMGHRLKFIKEIQEFSPNATCRNISSMFSSFITGFCHGAWEEHWSPSFQSLETQNQGQLVS